MFYKKYIEEKIKEIGKEKVVLDLGGGKPFTKWLMPYKDLFKNSNYQTMDYDETTGATIIGDIQNIPLKDEVVDAVICHSVLEHVHNPILAFKEIRRVLKFGGKAFMYVPSIYPYHARNGHYGDYLIYFL